MINWPSKTPEESKNYGLNWSPALSKIPGEPTIVGSSWTKLSGSVTLGGDLIQSDARRTAIKLLGGTEDSVSVVRNIVELSDGQFLAADALVRVR